MELYPRKRTVWWPVVFYEDHKLAGHYSIYMEINSISPVAVTLCHLTVMCASELHILQSPCFTLTLSRESNDASVLVYTV